MSSRPRSSWKVGAGRARAIVAIAALVVVAVLVLFAAQLHSTQASAKRDVASRFHDRAAVASALTQAIFASASTADATKQYGAAVVSRRVLDQAVKAGHLEYVALFDERGRLIASSKGLTGAALGGVASRTAARRAALQRTPFAISGIVRNEGKPVIELAAVLPTTHGRRVVVSGFPPQLVSAFMGGYLARIPSRSGTAYVVDDHANVLGSSDPRVAVAEPVADTSLVGAIRQRSEGSFGDDGYFAAVAVPTTSWRVVLTASRSSLFTSVSGARKWVPWLIFGAFAVVALASLLLLRRWLTSAAALSESHHELEATNAQLEANNAALRNAAELARSNAELEQFASIASHDLQEPLRKVQTFAAQLNARERERLSDEGQDFLRRMTDAAGRMRTLIDDLLMFSRVSTQGRPFVPVDLNGVIRDVMPDLELTIEETGAKVHIGDLPVIAADPVQLRQLLQNLLGNALKFRRDGVVPEVRVEASVVDGIAELSVSDNGIGFDPKYASRIFRAFERLHGSGAYPGTGIGLALCRKIVERHNGTITAEGSEMGGALFTVRLPVEQAEAMPDPPSSVFPDALDDPVAVQEAQIHA